MKIIPLWIALALSATSCKSKSDESAPSTAAKPVEPKPAVGKPAGTPTEVKPASPSSEEGAGTAIAMAEGANVPIRDDAEWKTATEGMHKRVVEMFAAAGTDCAKATTQLTDYATFTKNLSAKLATYEQAHPSVRDSEADVARRQKELEAAGSKLLEACKNDKAFVAAIAGPSRKN